MSMNDNVVRCPHCLYDYMHQDKVEVFDRQEDADVGIHAIVTAGKATFNYSMNGNPSSRRDGVRIEFFCEGCDKRSVMTIIQHKGQTFTEMRVLED